jgi:hypothetical protein
MQLEYDYKLEGYHEAFLWWLVIVPESHKSVLGISETA